MFLEMFASYLKSTLLYKRWIKEQQIKCLTIVTSRKGRYGEVLGGIWQVILTVLLYVREFSPLDLLHPDMRLHPAMSATPKGLTIVTLQLFLFIFHF